MAKIQCKAQVVSVEKLQEGIFSMWLEVPEIASQAAAGQFISLYCKSEDKLLPRPISLCEIDKEKGQLRLVFRVVGYGTDEFSHMKAGEEITYAYAAAGERAAWQGNRSCGLPGCRHISYERTGGGSRSGGSSYGGRKSGN